MTITVVGHGGACCGVRHLYSFDNATIADLDAKIRSVTELNNIGRGDSGRLIEIILSERQVTGGRPEGAQANGRWAPCVQAAGGWTEVLRQRGFRFVSRFNNANSGQNCYIFHYVPNFLSLTDIPFQWGEPDMDDNGGMAINRTLAIPARVAGDGTLQYGDRVRVRVTRGEAGGHDGREGVVTATPPGYRGQRDEYFYINIDDGPRNFAIYTVNLERITAPVAVASFYANVLRVGRSSNLSQTFADARRKAPRANRVDRLEVYSDGRERWVEGVTE